VANELGRKHSIVTAEHTFRIALSAFQRKDLRLAVSRGITAVIQASSAAIGAPEEIKERADKVVQGVRKLVQGVVIKRAISGLSAIRPYRPRSMSIMPKSSVQMKQEQEAREAKREQEEEFGPDITEIVRGPGAAPVTIPWEAVRCEQAGMPGGPVFFPADDPYDLWDFFTGKQLPTYDMAICASGIAVSERASARAEWLYDRYKERRIAEEMTRERTFEGFKDVFYRPIRLGKLL